MYENRCLFNFYLATRWHHMCFMNKHHQSIWCHKMGATCSSNVYSNWHIGLHSLPARTKYDTDDRWLLVFTLPLDGITCVSWINTINQYNARRSLKPVPDTCTLCGNLFLFGATNTLGDTLLARTKHENRRLLVFTLLLDGVSHEFHARRWVQPVPDTCT